MREEKDQNKFLLPTGEKIRMRGNKKRPKAVLLSLFK